MGSTRHGMRDVELVEVDASGTGAPSPGAWTPDDLAAGLTAHRPVDPADPSGEPSRRLHSRVRRSWVAGALAVLTVGVAGSAVAGQYRERVRIAELSGVTGVLQPVDGPVTERWRTEMPLWIELAEVGDMLVGVTDTRGSVRHVDVIAVDARTGETVWTTTTARDDRPPLGGLRCSVPDAAPGATDADRLVVCLVVEALGPSEFDRAQFEPIRSRMIVLRASTGELVSERSVDPTTSVTALGADVVVKDIGPDGRVRVTRTDPLGEQERWTFTGPPNRDPLEYTSVRVDDDLVVVPGAAGWVLSADGDVVESWAAERPRSAGWAQVLGGRTLVRPVRDAVGATTVTDLRTGAEFTADAYPLTDATDDGSAGELTLMQSSAGEGLLALDPSGEVVWTSPGPDSGGMLVLDGRVIRVGSESMEALDVRTGEAVWQTPVPDASQYGLLTDGRYVLRAENDPEDDVVVVARRVDDGRVAWQADVPDDVQHLFVVSGRLYGYTPDGLLALGEPDA